MAKRGIRLDFKPAMHTDAVTGEQKMILRSAHANHHSPRVLAHQKCVRAALEGKHPGDARAVRANFTAASKSCAGRGR